MGFVKASGIYSKGPLTAEAITWLPLRAHTLKHQPLSTGSSHLSS